MSLFNYFEKAFCISLPESVDRRKRVEKQFKKIGIECEFIDGIRPKDKQNFPTPGALGCFQAHLKVLELASQYKKPVLIFEDDVLLSRKLIDLDLSELEGIDWSFFYLGYLFFNPPKFKSVDSSFKFPDSDSVFATHAYSVHPKYLEDLKSFLNQIKEKRPMHLDGAYSTYRRERNLLPVLAKQNMVVQSMGFSYVMESNAKPFRKFIKRSFAYLKRFFLELFF